MDSFKQIGLLRNSAKYSHDSHNDIYHASCIIHISSVVSTSVDETSKRLHCVLSCSVEAYRGFETYPTYPNIDSSYDDVYDVFWICEVMLSGRRNGQVGSSPAQRCQVLPGQPSQIQVAQKVAHRECSVLDRHQLLSHIDPHCITLLATRNNQKHSKMWRGVRNPIEVVAVHCHSGNDKELLRRHYDRFVSYPLQMEGLKK